MRQLRGGQWRPVVAGHGAEARHALGVAVDRGLPQAPRTLLRKMIAEGRLGVKNGRGFYDYPSGS